MPVNIYFSQKCYDFHGMRVFSINNKFRLGRVAKNSPDRNKTYFIGILIFSDGGPYFIKARNAGGDEKDSDICATLSSPCDGGGWTVIGTIPRDEEARGKHMVVVFLPKLDERIQSINSQLSNGTLFLA